MLITSNTFHFNCFVACGVSTYFCLNEGGGDYVTFDFFPPHRVSSVHENDRLSSVAAELQFKSLSRHSSPTEDREGTDALHVFVRELSLVYQTYSVSFLLCFQSRRILKQTPAVPPGAAGSSATLSASQKVE